MFSFNWEGNKATELFKQMWWCLIHIAWYESAYLSHRNCFLTKQDEDCGWCIILSSLSYYWKRNDPVRRTAVPFSIRKANKSGNVSPVSGAAPESGSGAHCRVEIGCFTTLSGTSFSGPSKMDALTVVCVRYISFYRHRRNSRFVSMFTRRTRRGIKLWGKPTIRKTLWARARTHNIFSNGRGKNNGKEIDWTKYEKMKSQTSFGKGVSPALCT